VTMAGHECRIIKDEVTLRVCIYCGSPKWKLELNTDKGVYSCWVCHAKGRLDQFLQSLTGRQYQIQVTQRQRPAGAPQGPPAEFQSRAVLDVPSAHLYLAQRGVTPAEADTFGIRVCVEVGHRLEGRIVIPARDYYSGELLGWVGRSYTGQQPKYLITMPHRVVTGWASRVPGAGVVIVEGHMDGMAVRRAGFSAAVLGGTSVPGVAEWAARLSPSSLVVVMLDPDAEEQARKIYWTVAAIQGESKVRMIRLLGEHDPAALGPSNIRAIIESIGPQAGTYQVDPYGTSNLGGVR